jgi:hypothetical protein
MLFLAIDWALMATDWCITGIVKHMIVLEVSSFRPPNKKDASLLHWHINPFKMEEIACLF